MFTLFNFQSLLSSCPSPSLSVPTELNHKVLFLLLFLGWSWLPCGAPAVCVNQHLVAHTSSHLWQNAQRRETGGVKFKNCKEKERESVWEIYQSPVLLILLCCSLITWLISDWITITVPGDTFHSHTFHIPEMYWQIHMCRHQSAVSLTAAAPPPLKQKKVKKGREKVKSGSCGRTVFSLSGF